MAHPPRRECEIPQCRKCLQREVEKSGDGDNPDEPDEPDDRPRAFGGRLVKAEDPRQVDPADADNPLPSGGPLDGDAIEELNEAFDAAAEASAPDPDALEARRREGSGGSAVDLTAEDIADAQRSTDEKILARLDALAGGDGVRKESDDGEGTLQEQDLADAVANLLGVSPERVREGFDTLRDDDGDGDDLEALAERVADMLGVPVGAVLDVFEDMDTDGEGSESDGATKAIAKAVGGGARIGTDQYGQVAVANQSGESVPLDALAGSRSNHAQ